MAHPARPNILQPFRGAQVEKAHPAARGLIARWLFNEGSGLEVHDLSLNDHKGTLTNMVESDWIPGFDGYALNFDGSDDHIVVDNSAGVLSFVNADPFTFSIWLRTITATPSAVMNFFSKTNPGGNLSGILLSVRGDQANDPYEFHLRGASSGENITITFPNNNSGEWHFLTYTYDGSALAAGANLYEDSILLTPTVAADNLITEITNSGPVQISGRNGTITVFDGDLGNPGIYNRELTQDEITRLFINQYALIR